MHISFLSVVWWADGECPPPPLFIYLFTSGSILHDTKYIVFQKQHRTRDNFSKIHRHSKTLTRCWFNHIRTTTLSGPHQVLFYLFYKSILFNIPHFFLPASFLYDNNMLSTSEMLLCRSFCCLVAVSVYQATIMRCHALVNGKCTCKTAIANSSLIISVLFISRKSST